MFRSKFTRLFLSLVLFTATSLSLPSLSFATSLTDLIDTLSTQTVSETSTHTLTFTTLTNSPIQQVNVQFSTTENGSTKPAGLDLANTSLSATSGLGSGWSLSVTGASTGLLVLSRETADTIADQTAASITLANITNPALGNCDAGTETLSDTCYVKVTTYSDTGTTAVDSGSSSYTITEDPYLSFEVSGVSEGQTHNGITTTTASTPNKLPFSYLASGQVKYIAQELNIQTNAPNGYTVYAYVEHNLRGTTPANTINPFSAVNATWENPQPWSQPTGDTANTDTGWFGANTTDTRVNTAWANGAYLFGPISVAPHAVAFSEHSDRTGSQIYVTYALSVNSAQPPDTYSTNLIYDVRTSY